MNLEAAEHDVFDDFGEVETQEVALAANENTLIEPVVEREIKTSGFSWAAFAGGLAALVWIGGAIGGPLSYYGVDALMAMDPAMQAGLIALAFGPAILFWLGAAAAGEAVRARRLAVELTRMAHEARMPAEIGEAQAQRLSVTVKNEIDSLNDAVAAALNRLNELEHVAQRNAALFDGAVASSRETTEFMAGQLVRERDAIIELNGELRGQTETMAHSIGRQVRLMREASKLVKTEIGAAEDALESHLASFAATATVMAERTSSFHHVADSAAVAATTLNSTMSVMLDGLGEATKMTDAARQSAEQAVLAANETASAVRETTQRAVFEAKRAAQVIRAETVALQDAAAETLAKLQCAAEAARAASEESQAAADRHSASIEKRLSQLALTAGAVRKPTPAPVAAAPRAERPVERAPVAAPSYDDRGLYAAATRQAARPQARVAPAAVAAERQERQASKGLGGLKGFGGWGNFLPSNHREEEYRAPTTRTPEEADAFDLVDFAPAKKNPDTELKNDAIDLIAAAGVDLDDALAASDLELIAQSSRHGATARRQAVVDAAPSAVNRIARHVKRNGEAKQLASEFRARPDLAKSEKKGEGSDLVRAYLLIDAALA